MQHARVVAAVSFILLGAAGAAAQSFSSGSTGAQGAFPASEIAAAGSGSWRIDLQGGTVTAFGSTGQVLASVSLPGASNSGDAFPTGQLDFTTFDVPAFVNLTFGKNTLNTPITIRATGDVTIAGTVDVSGKDGAFRSTTGVSPGGQGGNGGFDGGQGGSQGIAGVRANSPGGPGLGKNGGAGGAAEAGETSGNGAGGRFPHGNESLLPLVGGSGGGGGRGSQATDGSDNQSGAGGGGGGGAILIASSTRIVISGAVKALGGGGGNGFPSSGCTVCSGWGGGGSGGGIRLMANRIEIGSISPGTGVFAGGGGGANPGGVGTIRIETFESIISSAEVNPPASFGLPGIVAPVNLPRLRISSIGGVSVPDVASGAVDVTLPSGEGAPVNPMAIVVSATGVPDGTQISVSVKTSTVESTASGQLSSGGFTANMTVPSGVSYIQASSAAFPIAAELQRELPLYQGEVIMMASVESDGVASRTYFHTGSGARVAADVLLGFQ